jgi:hypothetical protein
LSSRAAVCFAAGVFFTSLFSIIFFALANFFLFSKKRKFLLAVRGFAPYNPQITKIRAFSWPQPYRKIFDFQKPPLPPENFGLEFSPRLSLF